MRTKSLSFSNDNVLLVSGIKTAVKDDKRNLYLFAQPGRELVLPVAINVPPLIMLPEHDEGLGVLQLSSLSFAPSRTGVLYAASEIDLLDHVLLFIDTCDDHAVSRCTGEYELPRDHDDRLPHGYVATRGVQAHYGLIVCPPLGSCLIRSSAGRLLKLRLDLKGKFFRIPCDARDRALMEGLH